MIYRKDGNTYYKINDPPIGMDEVQIIELDNKNLFMYDSVYGNMYKEYGEPCSSEEWDEALARIKKMALSI